MSFLKRCCVSYKNQRLIRQTLSNEEIEIVAADEKLFERMNNSSNAVESKRSSYVYLCTKILQEVQDPALKSELLDIWAGYSEEKADYFRIVSILSSPSFLNMDLGKYQTSEYIGGLFQKAQDQKKEFDAYLIAIKLSKLESKGNLESLFKNDPDENGKFRTLWKERFSQIVEKEAIDLIKELDARIAKKREPQSTRTSYPARDIYSNLDASTSKSEDAKTDSDLIAKAKITLESSSYTIGGISDNPKDGTTNQIYLELAKRLLTFLEMTSSNKTLKKFVKEITGVEPYNQDVFNLWSKISKVLTQVRGVFGGSKKAS